MLADTAFALGKTHAVCQDYARVSPDGNRVMVADGCSSSPNTDFGARLLCHMVENPPQGVSLLFFQALYIAQQLGLASRALDSTLLWVERTEQGFTVQVCGDGVVVGRRLDGALETWDIQCPNNAPCYLSYLDDPLRLEAYLNLTEGVRNIRHTGKDIVEWQEKAFHGFQHYHPFLLALPSDQYDLVMILTDGVHSFQRREGTSFLSLPFEEVLTHLLDFKVMTPGFLQRRFNKFLRSWCPNQGWHHNDDLAAGVIYLEQEE